MLGHARVGGIGAVTEVGVLKLFLSEVREVVDLQGEIGLLCIDAVDLSKVLLEYREAGGKLIGGFVVLAVGGNEADELIKLVRVLVLKGGNRGAVLGRRECK